MNRVLLVVCVGLAMACGSEVVCPDGTDLLGGACVADDGGADVCRSDDECSDGLFCTGVERCNPTSEAADARGCVVGERPCPGAGCVESTRTCDESCPDADGDGYADAACGGDDCDDGNPRIHPGAVEVCDSAGVDEDCDPSTLGPDRDGDGYIGVECCNLQPNGELHCGTDCDDTMANVHPSAPEVCNGIDDDCDGLIDEGVTTTYYRDLDGDNYGNPEVTIQACSPPSGWTILCCDCNDEDPRVNPAATELCMPPGVDEDCDGAIDEGCDCTFMGSRTCGPGAPHAGVGVCRDGTQTCSAAGTLSECVGGVFPTAEVCDGLDNDCDGRVDEGFPCQRNEMVAGTTSCGRPGFRRCDASCNWLDDTFYAPAETVSSCDYCADTLGGHDAESPHLVSRTSTNLRSGTTGHQFFGDANCTYQYGSCYSLSLHQRDRIDAAVLVDGRGAFFRDEPIDIGYGPMVVSVSVRPRGLPPGGYPMEAAQPRQGWALTILAAGSGTERFTDDVLTIGVPMGRDGWSFEWRYFDPGGEFGELDVVSVRLLRRGATSSVLHTFVPTTPHMNVYNMVENLEQLIDIEIVPDNPATASDETSMFVRERSCPDGVLCNWRFRCGGDSGVPCGRRVRPGDRFEIGVMSASGGTGGRNRTSNSVGVFSVRRDRHCP